MIVKTERFNLFLLCDLSGLARYKNLFAQKRNGAEKN